MKRNLLFLSALIIIATSYFSQSTYNKLLDKDTTTWQHFSCWIPVNQHEKINQNSIGNPEYPIVAIDTITINSKLYKKVYALNNFGLNYTGKTPSGFMREDTIAKKVYFIENASSPEYLLYDFSLAVNDSVFLTFPYSVSYNGYYRCDSIVTKNEASGPRKHFFLRKHLGNSQPNILYHDHIEGIGSTYTTLYIYYPGYYSPGYFSYSVGSCRHPWSIGLACKHNDTKKQFQSCTYVLAQQNACLSPVDSCNYRTVCSGLKNNDWDRRIKMGPNPCDNELQLTIENPFKNAKMIITDLSGKVYMEMTIDKAKLNNNTIRVSTKDLNAGIYLLELNLDDAQLKRSLMIQH